MSYLKLHEIKEIHLELTQRCNADCPQCARNILGAGTNPHLRQAELSLADIQQMLPADFCRGLRHVLLCGNYGDPGVAKEALEIIHYLKSSGVPSVWVHTNGGMRAPSWWAQLGAYLQDEHDRVAFGVDGLREELELYRRNVSWEKVRENMRACIQAGGRARWDYLVFRHNEHQLNEAIGLAQEMGFVDFRIRKTSRFSRPFARQTEVDWPVLKKVNREEVQEYIDRVAQKDVPEDNIAYWLQAPQDVKYKNADATFHLQDIFNKHRNFATYMSETEINCIYRDRFKRVYISAEAELWPCCYIAGDMLTWNRSHDYREDLRAKVVQRYGAGFNDLRRHTLAELLEHPWFASQLADSWSRSLEDADNPRLKKCARTCGKSFNPILSQTVSLSLWPRSTESQAWT